MKIKVSEATSLQLDYLVLTTMGTGTYWQSKEFRDVFSPTTIWAQGGPIIERERISIRPDVASPDFRAYVIRPPDGLSPRYVGPTPLIAAMRCYCSTKLGDIVDVPEELTCTQS